MSDSDAEIAPARETSQDREEEKVDEGYNPDFEDAPVPAGTILPQEQHSKPVDQRGARRERRSAQ